MGEKINEMLIAHELGNFTVFGVKFVITNTIAVMWVIMAVMIFLAWFLTRKMQEVPSGKQNAAEAFVELLEKMMHDNIGHHGKHFTAYLGTVLLFLLIGNTISVFNIFPSAEDWYHMTGLEIFEKLPSFHLSPPTKDVLVTATLAVMSIVLVLFSGIIIKKPKGFLKSFIEPVPVVLPFKILDYFIRPLSLCFRLFGNIFGAFIVMELAYMALPLAFPGVLSIYFDLFDGMLQAYIFVFLTSLYIAEAIE